MDGTDGVEIPDLAASLHIFSDDLALESTTCLSGEARGEWLNGMTVSPTTLCWFCMVYRLSHTVITLVHLSAVNVSTPFSVCIKSQMIIGIGVCKCDEISVLLLATRCDGAYREHGCG